MSIYPWNPSVRHSFRWSGFMVLATAGYLLIPKDLAFTSLIIGLDHSWMISLNLALLRKAQFGADYIFTYGPLGFLYTRVILGQSKWILVASDGFFLINILYIIYKYYSNIAVKTPLLAGFTVILIAILSQHINCLLALFIILLFHCSAICNNYKRPVSLIVSAICASVLPFIKLNYGFVAIPVFYLAFILVLYKNGYKAFLYVVPAVVINIALILFFANHYNVNLQGYIQSGIYIIRDYTDSVAIGDNNYSPYLMGYLIIIFMYAVAFLVLGIRRFNVAECYLHFVIMLALYLSFKNGFVREDIIHTTYGYLILPLLGALPAAFATDFFAKYIYFSLNAINLFFCFLFRESPDNLFGNIRLEEFNTNYFSQIIKTSGELSRYNLKVPDEKKIDSIKAIISGKSIDIFPHMAMYAYAAGLNYSPRPVPQSYQAYDLFLDSVNSLKLTADNPSAPEYLLFANGTIDQRYPFGDESITKRAIMQYYQPVDTFSLMSIVRSGEKNQVILFKRRNAPVRLVQRYEIHETKEMDEWITTDSSTNLQYLYADVKYSFTGNCKRILYKSPELFIQMRDEDGHISQYTSIVPILKTGILVNKAANNTPDAYTLFSSYGKASKKVLAVRFCPTENGFFNPVIRLTLKSYSAANR